MNFLSKLIHKPSEETLLLSTKAKTAVEREKELYDLGYQLKHKIFIDRVESYDNINAKPVRIFNRNYLRHFSDGLEILTGFNCFQVDLFVEKEKRHIHFGYSQKKLIPEEKEDQNLEKSSDLLY